MKPFQTILVGAAATAALGITSLAIAQGLGSDEFGAVTTRLLAAWETTTNTLIVTNSSTDLNNMTGIGKITLNFASDNSAGVGAFVVQSSADTTNWATLGNVALGVSTAITKTNSLAAGGSITNIYTNFLSGTGVTTPTASTAGFATPYIPALLFTNTASVSITNAGVATLGFIINDANRYLRLKVTCSGTFTNSGWTADITGTPR